MFDLLICLLGDGPSRDLLRSQAQKGSDQGGGELHDCLVVVTRDGCWSNIVSEDETKSVRQRNLR